MNAGSLVRSLARAAETAGLGLGDPAALSLTVYAINDEAYGSQNLLVGDARGYRVVFKRAREKRFGDRLQARMQALNERLERPGHAGLRERIVRMFPVDVEGRTWLLSPYASGRSAYVEIRSDPLQRKVVDHFGRALELSAALHALADGRVRLGELIEQARRAAERLPGAPPIASPEALDRDVELAVGIAHLDLVPDNLLVSRRAALWVDWEYWDEAPVVFNVFDALLSFGSLAGLRPWARRAEDAGIRAFGSGVAAPWPAIEARLRAHLEAVAPRLQAPASVRALVDAYFVAKATTQLRVYGESFGFARGKLADWTRVAELPELVDGFARRWPGCG